MGTYSPPFGFENNVDEMNKIKEMIKEAKPHILIVGLGCQNKKSLCNIIVGIWAFRFHLV